MQAHHGCRPWVLPFSVIGELGKMSKPEELLTSGLMGAIGPILEQLERELNEIARGQKAVLTDIQNGR